MQEEARTKSLKDYPWGQLFRDLHSKGAHRPLDVLERQLSQIREGRL